MTNTKTSASIKTARKQRGRVDRTVMFPVALPKVELPEDYPSWLAELKHRIQSERLRFDKWIPRKKQRRTSSCSCARRQLNS